MALKPLSALAYPNELKLGNHFRNLAGEQKLRLSFTRLLFYLTVLFNYHKKLRAIG